MALIGKIRNNSWILIVMIAVGMGGFLLQDVVTNQGQRQAGNFELANVNGQSIDYREFQQTEDVLYSGATNSDAYSQKASLWRYFTEKAIVDNEAEQLGIGVSKEELLDLQFGQNPSPIIMARFKNQSGQLDRERLNSFRDAIEANELDARFKQYWAVQEKEIIKERKQLKLQNLFGKAIYTPNWMAEEISKESTSSLEFEYLQIPFSVIPDEEIVLNDEVIRAYLEKNQAKYKNKEESRVLNYIEFKVNPTAGDSLANKNQLAEIAVEFKNATNDSLFVLNNSGNYSFVYYKPEDLPEQVKEVVPTMETGDVFGPYLDVDKYTIAKLVNKQMVADSVEARHILRTVNTQDVNSYVSAQAMIDSLKNLLDQGLASFDSLAIKFSQDPGSSFKGGELGYFAQGVMVPSFNNACFFGDENEYQVINTQFGIHLIDIQNRKFIDNNPKYKVAYISNTIVPSQMTQDSIYDSATELVTSSTSLEDLVNIISSDSTMQIKESSPLKQNDYFFMNYGSAPASRDMIRWAYEPGVEVGDISPVVYTYTDKVNYYNSDYLVIALKKIFPKGLKSAEEARNSVELLAGNELKAQKIIEKTTGKDLNAVAELFNLKVDTLSAITYNTTMIPGLGNEPKLLNLVYNGTINEVAGPVAGNMGVYLAKPMIINISEQAASNVIQQKNNLETSTRNELNFKFMEALKNKADMEDNRYNFF